MGVDLGWILGNERSSMTPSEQLHALATRQPAARALVVTADRTPISYRELARLVDRLAEKLQRTGLSSGGPSELAIPCWPVSAPAGNSAASSAELDVIAAPLPPPPPPEGLAANDAAIMFTGGMTGTPKMVPWTHDNIVGSVNSVIDTYRLGPQDATVAAMPLFHGHRLVAVLLSTLASGGTVLLPAGGRFSAHTFWDDIDAARATWFTAVPTIHRIMLARNDTDPSGSRGQALRFIRSCSAPTGFEDRRSVANRVRRPGTVRLRDDRSHPPGGQHAP